jgi:hypothetical protein
MKSNKPMDASVLRTPAPLIGALGVTKRDGRGTIGHGGNCDYQD